MQTEGTERAAGARAAWSLLRRNADFRRLFVASVISLGGDWFLFVALGGLVFDTTGNATSVGLLIVSQVLPIFVATPWAGWLADRLDRRRLMIVCDLARAATCLAFLTVGPESLWLAYVLVAILSLFAAAFDPAFSAATPNAVEPEDLATANALAGSLWGIMLAVGASLGGVVSTVFGADTAFIADSVSFALSAALLFRVRRALSEARAEEDHHIGILAATVETARYARRDHRVLALIAVKFGLGMAAGVLALIAVFAKGVFHAGDVGFGLLMAARGVGALVGPFAGHRLAGPNHERLLPIIGGAMALFGFGYMAVGVMPTLGLAALMILIAHLGGGAQWVLSAYGLQRLVPDRIRGRIFAFDFALVTLTLGVSSMLAGWLADVLSPRAAVMIVGGIAFGWTGVWLLLTREVRRTPIFEGCGDAPEEPVGPLPLAVE